jgi:(R,R)-butanediol dehydrogenase / meso-butanediol dehydrogenase / diacetyl reductase
MRAAVLTGPGGQLRIDEIPEVPPSADDVLIDVTACGICGSDLHIARAVGAPGTVLGHEIAGRVAAIGSAVDGWTVGTPVAIRPFDGCSTCPWCAAGRADHCSQFRLLGLQQSGGFAEQVTVNANHLFRLPATVTGVDQALVEPAAVGLHALRRAGFATGEDVLILGGGPVGLAITAWARTLGADRITVTEPVAIRRELALALGADVAVDPAVADAAGLLDTAANPPLVMECTGAPGQLAQGLMRAGVNGRIGVVGICLAPEPILPIIGFHKELDVRFAMYYDHADFLDTITALGDGSLNLTSLVTETIPLAALPKRFEELLAAPEAGKVVVSC